MVALIACGCQLLPGHEPGPLPVLEPTTFGLPLTAEVRTMVLLSGWPDTHTVWANTVKEFEREYHIVSVATPDFDRPALRSRWGYKLSAIPQMLSFAINGHLGPQRKIDVLVAHDWGCAWAFAILQNAASRRVDKLVAIDIGAFRATPSSALLLPRKVVWALPYQLAFATIFFVGAAGTPSLANQLLAAAWDTIAYFGPLNADFDWDSQSPRPAHEVKWWMGYPYYQLWSNVLKGKLPEIVPLFPKIPTMFAYGARKRVHFHPDEFISHLNSTSGCRVVEYPSSHWVMHEQPAALHSDMRAFLD
jgi:pimeloyl-ACP methyl ester carboxylesterase